MNYREKTKTILVPTDFTAVENAALKHATLLAEKLRKSITLLHVIESYEERAKTMEKLENIASKHMKATGIETDYTTSIGTIFEEIGKVGDIVKAAYIVMGTHGISGMQKITGSRALKVITRSYEPYVVVQKMPQNDGYKNIVIPVDHRFECKQMLFSISDLARLFQATCHLVYPKSKDEHIGQSIKNNLAFAESFFDENLIKYQSFNVTNHLSSFYEDSLNYAANIKADLMTLITEQNLTILEFLLRPAEQYIIANDSAIPVLCIHPDYSAVQYDSFMTIR